MDSYENGTIHHVNGIDLYVVDEGSGPAVLLLHGFPNTAHLWRNQIPALVAEGYRVIAPDLRGYGRTSILENVDDYSVINVTEDLRSLMDELEIKDAHVVGHDWGAATAWAFASFYAPRVTSLVAISVGHPASFTKASVQQLARSWYMMFFQFKGVAETLMSANNWALFRAGLKNEADIERWIEDLSRPGALTAALNWYRANVPPSSYLTDSGIDWPRIEVPVMGIWSSKDFALLEEQMTGSAEYVAGPWRYERLEGVGHWMQTEAPEQVNSLLLDFLAR
ncbi:MAG TPA: alpha/beta hydrolase [Actinomycetota bacterium]|nr:alpha/beta hydrolase [Actinomycetota bacterium]